MSKAIALLLLLTFSIQTMAQSFMPNKSVSSIMQKYDYLLNVHPEAHLTQFKEAQLKNFEMEITEIAKTKSPKQLRAEVKAILNQIPTREQRVTFDKIIKNSTPKEIAAFLLNPSLLQSALQGEGANFALNFNSENLLQYITLALAAALILAIIIEVVKNAQYEHFRASVGGSCGGLSSFEKDAIKQRAKDKCYTQAKYPGTCEQDDFGTQTESSYDEYGDTTSTWDICEAHWRAKKRLTRL